MHTKSEKSETSCTVLWSTIDDSFVDAMQSSILAETSKNVNYVRVIHVIGEYGVILFGENFWLAKITDRQTDR